MHSLNNVLNNIHDWSQPVNPDSGVSQGFLKTQVATRVAEWMVAFPTEIFAIAENVLFDAPLNLGGTAAKVIIKPISWISGSETLHNWDKKLPGLTDFIKTIGRVILYTIGAISTLTLGLAYPNGNFKIHTSILGIVTDEREAATKAALLEIELQKAAVETNKIQEDAAKKIEDAKKKAERDLEELHILNNLATAEEIANNALKDGEDAIISDVGSIFEEAKEEVQNIREKHHSPAQKNFTQQTEISALGEYVDFQKEVEEATEPSGIRKIFDAVTLGYFKESEAI